MSIRAFCRVSQELLSDNLVVRHLMFVQFAAQQLWH